VVGRVSIADGVLGIDRSHTRPQVNPTTASHIPNRSSRPSRTARRFPAGSARSQTPASSAPSVSPTTTMTAMAASARTRQHPSTSEQPTRPAPKSSQPTPPAPTDSGPPIRGAGSINHPSSYRQCDQSLPPRS
jgi:hypothetical protein